MFIPHQQWNYSLLQTINVDQYVVALQNFRWDSEQQQQVTGNKSLTITEVSLNTQIIHVNIQTWAFTHFPPMCLRERNWFVIKILQSFSL